jgi:hypothetical protein
MKRKTAANWIHVVRTLIALYVFASSISDICAGESEATRTLVGLVGNEEVGDEKEVSSLYTSIALDSIYKPVASQSLALLQMRQGKYAEAWKLLSAQTDGLSSMPMSFRVGNEKLMLWLWLQAGSASQAESQFNKLVNAAIHKDLQDPDRRDICHFLGGIIGMLQSSGDTSCIAAATLEQGRASLEKIESKISLEQFRSGLKSATEWQQALEARLRDFTQADPAHADNVLAELKRTLDSKSSDRSDLLEELKRKKVGLNALNDEVKKLQRNQNQLINAWNMATPGKPSIPSKPSMPRRPRTEYETTYTTDSKTGKRTATGRKETDASERANDRYESEMRQYHQKLSKYESDVQAYPARLAAWTKTDAIRRANLQASKKTTDEELSFKKPMQEDALADVKEKTATSKSLENEMRLTKATIAIASTAKQQIDSKVPTTSSFIKPSYFQLLDFDSEVFRLERCLREMLRK